MRSCNDCVHKKVCGPRKMAKKMVVEMGRTDPYRVRAFEIGLEHLAENCEDHMVLDRRSVEIFTEGIESMKSAFRWSISMNDMMQRKSSTDQHTIWLGGTYLDVLQGGLDTAEKLIKISKNEKT